MRYRGYTPPRPSGSSRHALNAQALWDQTYGAQGQINNSSTVKVKSTTKGIFFEAADASAPGKSGIIYKGDFDNTKAYKKNDLVRVRTAPVINGIFICVKDNPLVGGFSIAPTFPEPADSGGTNIWEMFCPWVKLYTSCRNGAGHNNYLAIIELP